MKAAPGQVSDWYFGLRAARSLLISNGQDADAMTPADALDEAFITNTRRNITMADEAMLIQLATIGSWGREGREDFVKTLNRLKGQD